MELGLASGGSVTSVPVLPSLCSVKFPAVYCPSNWRVAVCVPSVTVSVPLLVPPE